MARKYSYFGGKLVLPLKNRRQHEHCFLASYTSYPSSPAKSARSRSRRNRQNRLNLVSFPAPPGFEIDVQLSEDSQIIIMHDPTLNRTTNGTGLVSSRPWTGYIEHLVTRDAWGNAYPVPRFGDMLDVLVQMPGIMIVDIKCHPRVIRLMANEIRKRPSTDFSKRIFFGFWVEKFYLEELRKWLPGFSVSYISENATLAQQLMESTTTESFNMNFECVRDDPSMFARRARRTGRKVFVWTVNDKEDMFDATDIVGVDAILTDDPGLCIEMRKEEWRVA
ncbi:hypothetical protein HK104_002351 [Borealophlyctis nickersoniae]|nr:hypothetical protein HK104_002351 [Borealophlyctis nickersoniae]